MYLENSKIVVIKIGSSLLIDDNKKIIIVSSGAIAMGCKKLNISKKKT